jgi:hypothetical protein
MIGSKMTSSPDCHDCAVDERTNRRAWSLVSRGKARDVLATEPLTATPPISSGREAKQEEHRYGRGGQQYDREEGGQREQSTHPGAQGDASAAADN